MAWGEMTAEQITAKMKEAGFDTAQINERLKTLDNTASKTEVEAIQNSMKEIQNSLNSLQTTMQQQRETNNNNNPNNDPKERSNNGGGSVTRQEPLVIDPLKFMEDPQGAVNALLREQMTPVIQHSLSVAADVAYNMAKQRLPFFEMFESEIKEMWDKYPAQSKTKPDELVTNLYYLVKGRHADEIVTHTNKKEGKYAMVQSGGTQVIHRTEQNNQGKPEDNLTESELNAAKKLGITPADWAASKAGLKYV